MEQVLTRIVGEVGHGSQEGDISIALPLLGLLPFTSQYDRTDHLHCVLHANEKFSSYNNSSNISFTRLVIQIVVVNMERRAYPRQPSMPAKLNDTMQTHRV